MKIYQLPIEMVNALRSWFHPKDRSVILAPSTFIEGEEIVTPTHPTPPGNPAHNRGRLYWKDGCWTQLDEFGNELSFCFGTWENWSPALTQGVGVTRTINFARYMVMQKTVILRTIMTAAGAGTAGSAIIVGNLPFPIANTNSFGAIGSGVIVDSSVSAYAGVAVGVGANDIRVIFPAVGGNYIGVNPSFALASTDVISIFATYERT